MRTNGHFNHLIMSKTDYDKSQLSSWCSFEEYNLCTNAHVQNLGVKTTEDLDGSAFFVFVAGVIPSQKEKTQEGDKPYRLCFVLGSTGSMYSAFCRCKSGANQGCRHLVATLIFFQIKGSLSPLCLHIGTRHQMMIPGLIPLILDPRKVERK